MRRAAAGALRSALQPRAPPARPRPAARPPAAAVRPFSSSSPSAFFFRRPEKSTGELARELLGAVRSDRPDLVAKLYPQYVQLAASSPSGSTSTDAGSQPLTHQQLRTLMSFAARTKRYSLVRRIFNDLEPVHGLQPALFDHHHLVHGMVSTGRLSHAVQWLQAMQHTYGIAPTVSEYNVVLQGYRRQRDLEGMRRLVEAMRSAGVKPNVVTYNTFVSAFFEEGKFDDVRAVVKEMTAKGVQPDVFTETALLSGFLEANERASARQVHERLAKLVFAGGERDTAAVNALLYFEAVERGYEAALTLATRLRDEGYEFNQMTISTLIRQGTSKVRSADEGVELIEQLEDLFGSSADRHAWTMVLDELARQPDRLPQALQLYQVARDRSVQPDSGMVHPLLSALLLPSPTPANLVVAKSLYDDLATSSRSYSTAPDSSIYNILLRACASPHAPDLDWSRALVADMKERGVRLDGATAMWHIIALMRAAASFEEAFAAYDEIRALDPTVLDRAAYNTILAAFTGLTPAQTREPAPAPLVMEFLSDMRTSGHAPSSATFALLLTYYSRAESASPATVAHLHALIKLDVHVDPDSALFNALMGAYARVGAYNAAYRIWDSMCLNAAAAAGDEGGAGVDATSVSTLLDACAFDGSPAAQRRAERVWTDLVAGRMRGVRPNRKHLDSWVEALARWGRLHDAEEAAFAGASGGGGEGGLRAGVSTLETLLRFARREGTEEGERVAQRIRSERPDFWGEVEILAGRQGGRQRRREGRGKAAGELEFFDAATPP